MDGVWPSMVSDVLALDILANMQTGSIRVSPTCCQQVPPSWCTHPRLSSTHKEGPGPEHTGRRSCTRSTWPQERQPHPPMSQRRERPAEEGIACCQSRDTSLGCVPAPYWLPVVTYKPLPLLVSRWDCRWFAFLVMSRSKGGRAL